ncbi:MAG: hypothetical protein ABWY02_13765 [Telluria sp.]
MPKNFRDEIDSACDRALESFGFRSRRRGSPLIQIDDDFYGWVGLNRSGTGDEVRIDPYVGLHCVPVMRLFYELDFYRQPRSKYLLGRTATIVVHMGAFAPEMRAFIFERDAPLTSEANRLAEAVVEHGLPWMRTHASLDALLGPLREREAMLNGVPERIAIVLFLLGRFDELSAYLDRKQDEFAQHSGWVQVQEAWRKFASALRDRLPKDGQNPTACDSKALALPDIERGDTTRGSLARRGRFEKELLAALGPSIKGTGWKKSGSTLFRQSGDFYQEIRISVSLYDGKIVVSHYIKPMALDPILWDILGISENAGEPLSFRARGAFTCAGLPIHEEVLDQTGLTPDDAAMALSALVNNNELLFEEVLKGSDFSSLVAQHRNQRERGAYAVTLVTSLINDGDCDAAADLASAFESGEFQSCSNMSVKGVSYHRLALNWLAAKKLLAKFAL